MTNLLKLQAMHRPRPDLPEKTSRVQATTFRIILLTGLVLVAFPAPVPGGEIWGYLILILISILFVVNYCLTRRARFRLTRSGCWSGISEGQGRKPHLTLRGNRSG